MQIPPGSAELFQANSDIHAGAVKIVLFDNDITQVDADAESHPLVLRDGGIALRNLALDLYRAANGLDDAGELRDDTVPCAAEDVTAMRGDRFLHHSTVRAQSNCGGLFVELREAAIPHHIGSEDRSKPTFHGWGTRVSHANMADLHMV